MNKQALAERARVSKFYLPQTVQPKRIHGTTPSALQRFASTEEMVKQLKPELPVECLRLHAVERAAKWFIGNFPGNIMYSVKSNPDARVLQSLWNAGLRHFDVASITEVEQIASQFPGTKMYFMHPVKSREAIRRAYFDYGIRAFSLDSFEELEKIMDVTRGAPDLELYVRLAIANDHAALALTGKFGIAAHHADDLLKAVRDASAKVGLCFHVGSQCMDPISYGLALKQVRDLVDRTGVKIDAVDVGGGFPSVYPGMNPPALGTYMDAIREGLREYGFDENVEVFAEPGRALVAEGGSMVVRVELRKGGALYINDGTYGSLFDAGVPGWNYPMKAIRQHGGMSENLQPFTLFGPTCDSMDAMKGPFMLPADINEGDWIEIGQLGAYGQTLRTKFNGFYSEECVEVIDQPLMTMFERN